MRDVLVAALCRTCAAALIAALAFTAPADAPRARALTLLAAAAIAVSGAIGVYHAGVELKIFEGFTTCTATAKAADHRGPAEADRRRAAGPLRPGAMVVPRHLHGRVERDPVARRGRGDRLPDAPWIAPMSRWRPGDARPDRASMVRVDQAGEYGATRIYAGQLAVLRRNCPEAKLIARMAAQEDRHLRASMR